MSKKIGNIFMCGGLLLLAAAFALTLYRIWDDRRAGKAAADALVQMSAVVAAASPETDIQSNSGMGSTAEDTLPSNPYAETFIPDYILDPEMDMPTITALGEDYIGIIEVPSQRIYLPVLSEWSYDNLRLGPCCYTGSVYMDDMIILAHDYFSHFKAILNLYVGDDVKFTDSLGNIFQYTVVDLEVIDGNDRDSMLAGEWDLTLFTCTPNGQSRFTVRCERINGG